MSQPNVLFIFTDQQRHSALGAYNNSVIQTPNLDRLAQEGMTFDNAFSSCPICGPYRGQLMTGKFSHANGVLDNEYALSSDQTTIAQSFKQAGYHTGYIGKWHLGYGPYTEESRYGFDYMAANNCMHGYYSVAYHENEKGPINIDGWGPIEETDLTIQYLEQHKDEPFCLFLGWGPPHWPYDKYPDEYDIYDPNTVDLPPNVPRQMADFARREMADYYGNITGLDAQMARLHEALNRLNLTDNTIVVFTSDHGDHLSSHGYGKPGDRWMHHSRRASKATPYNESIHVPFLIRYPNHIPANARTDALLCSVDLMPTLLGLCDIDIPDDVQGTNLAHIALAQDGPQNDSVYLQILGPGWPHRGKWVGFWRGVRTQQYVYARWRNHEHETVLFDCENDPYEMTNLAGNPDYADLQIQLEQRMQKWIHDTNDPFQIGQRDPGTGILQLGQKFIHEKWDHPQ